MLKSLLGVFFFSFTNGLNLVPKDMDYRINSFENGEKVIKNNPNNLNINYSYNVYQSLITSYSSLNGIELNFDYVNFLTNVKKLNILNLSDLSTYYQKFHYVFSIYGINAYCRSYIRSNSGDFVAYYKGITIDWNIYNDDIYIYGENGDITSHSYENDLDSDNLLYVYSGGRVSLNYFDLYSIRGYFVSPDNLFLGLGYGYTLPQTPNVMEYYFTYQYSLYLGLNIHVENYTSNSMSIFYEGYFNYLEFVNSCLPISYVPYSLLNDYSFNQFYSGGKYAKFGLYELSQFTAVSGNYEVKINALNSSQYGSIWNNNNAFYVNGRIYNDLRLHWTTIHSLTEFVSLGKDGNVQDYIMLNDDATGHQYAYIDYVYAYDNNYGSINVFECYSGSFKYAGTDVNALVPLRQSVSANIYEFALLFNGSGFYKTLNGNKLTPVDILGMSYHYNDNIGSGGIGDGLQLINITFNSLSDMLLIQILPGLSLGLLLFLPLIATILVFVWRALNK